MKLITKATAIFDRTIEWLTVLASAVLLFVTFAVTSEVVFRYFFGRPTLWVLQTSENMLLYITFLGAAWVLRREGHVKIEVVLTRLKPRIQAMLGIITSIFGIIICVVFVWYGSVVTWDHFARHIYIEPIVKFPKGPVLAIIPIGGFLLLIQFLRRTRGYLRSWRAPPSKEQSPR